MINGESLLQTKKQKAHEESKYVYTELSKNYVPNYEDISDRIDFKIAPRLL
jgi:RNase P subunit RPR2